MTSAITESWLMSKNQLKYEIEIVGMGHLKGPSHLIRHPSKTPFKAPFKNRFFGIRYPYPRSGALTIRGYGYLEPKKKFLKGVLEGCLIK